MADNRERARALMLAVGRIDDEPQRSIADTIAAEEKVLMVLTAALDAAFSRGKDGALQKLHAELNKLRWAGADDGWERAISAVREHIAASLPLPTSPEEARGSASIADEATVERVALTEGVVDAARRWQSARQTVVTASLDGGSLPAGYVTVLATAECNLRDAVGARAAIPAPPAPLKAMPPHGGPK